MGQATHSSFSDLCIEVSAEPDSWEEHKKDLDRVVSTSIHERKAFQLLDSFAPEDLVPTELLLMQSLACVAATSEWRPESPHRPGMHFLAVRHFATPESYFHTLILPQESILRPGPLSDSEFCQIALSIVEADKNNHPDWFL